MALTSTQIKFLKEFYKKAGEICPEHSLNAIGAITAQAMCESNWNRSVLSKKYHNYFGMKCGSSWKGASVNMTTKEEYVPGTLSTIKDNFRAYESMEKGIEGYCSFITKLSRYKNLLGETDNLAYIKKIKADGWATSSVYVKTLTNILKTYVEPMCIKNETETSAISDYYPAYDGYSISLVVALRSVGADFSMVNRKKIAKANGITNYRGYASQNLKMLDLLKNGTLVKP